MSFNTLITQTISCFENVQKILNKINDEPYLLSVVSNLIEEWKQHIEPANETRHKRQMSDHVVCSKKSYEDTLQRLRRSSNLENKSARKTEDHLTIPSENAPSLPPRNAITRGTVLKERRSPPYRYNLLKTNSAAELELERRASDPPVRNTTPEIKSDSLLNSYESLIRVRAKSQTPEVGYRPESPLIVSKNSLENSLGSELMDSPPIKNTKSCSDLLEKVGKDSIGDSTLFSRSLRSSYVKFKLKNGKWAKMYLTLIGKNIYVSRNYADDQTELVYSLEKFDIVPKDEGKSKYLILLKTAEGTQCSISLKSSDVRDDWYKAMIRAKYRPTSKSSSGSLDLSPTEGEKLSKSREAIYVSPNDVNPNAARNLGIKVVINDGNDDDVYEDRKLKDVEKVENVEKDENMLETERRENELNGPSGEYVINHWDDVSDEIEETPYLSILSSPLQNKFSCSLAFGKKAQVCDENLHFYLQN